MYLVAKPFIGLRLSQPCCDEDQYLFSVITKQFTFEKQQGLCHDEVTLGIIPVQRLGNQVYNCKMSYCRSFKRLTIFLMNFQWIQWSLWHHSLDCVHSSYWISWHLSNSRLACLSCCSWGHHLVRAGDFGFIVCFKHFLVFESHLKIDFRMLILTTDSALNEVCSFEHYIFITSLFGSRIFQAVSISLCTADK